ncbi:zinc finger MYND domain-containing protein [Phanerochaete sordida]|uniref:Zinc finger MYND domain-containing protein n=1 Tax=Phanerochaete sordida TaxID=48140 RepID=A0A9P3GF47_9APHY|nr:zinc finger MYND domain-containing protein [Phanerochaete sordida]
MNQLRTRNAHRIAQWKPLHQTWTLLGRALEVDEHGTARIEPEEIRATFPLLARCNSSECLCSIHEPLHKLQTCRACSRVAYCNDRCQQKDWAEGGHKESCAGRTAPRTRRPDAESASFDPLLTFHAEDFQPRV